MFDAMDWLRELSRRLLMLFHRRKFDGDLDEEMRLHRELREQEQIERGLSPKDAHYGAQRRFGNDLVLREESRELWGWNWLENLLQDVRYGLRMLARNPGFTAVAVLTLALGIGANTALFSVVNGVLLNPLPFPEPDRLVALHESKPYFERSAIPYPNFVDWQKDNHSFSGMAAYRSTDLSLTGSGEAERLRAEYITADFFSLLGVKPILGRTFTQGEDRVGAAPVALIGEGLWRRKFGSSSDILGKTLALDGRGYTVVGVIPATFHLFVSFRGRDVYVPFGQWNNPFLLNREAALGIRGIGRLKPGVTLAQAMADMARVTENLARAYPDTNRGAGATLVPLKEQMVGSIRPLLFVLLGAVGFVLLIACVNVANLLLARSTSRSREFAVRLALGARRGRVIRQLLTESLLFAVAGGGLGLLLAFWGTEFALSQLPAGLPRVQEIGVDPPVLIFTLIVSLLAGVLFGLAPAMKTSKPGLHETLKESGRGAGGTRHPAQGLFVVAEIAMALVLLIGAGLMVRTLARIWSVDPGFDPQHVLSFSFAFPPSMSTASATAIRAACRQLDQKLESIPGIRAVSLSWGGFPISDEDDEHFWLDGQPKPKSENEMNWALSYVVEPGYLKAMGIRLERGRFFSAQDDEHSPVVVVVDDVFAHKFFLGRDPLGKRIHLNSFDQLAEIVGVVAHVKQWGLDSDDANPLRAQIYHSFIQLPDKAMALSASGIGAVVRSAETPAALANSIRGVTGEISNERVVYGVQTMEEIISDSLAARRISMTLLGAFAALALVLSSVGIYGVITVQPTTAAFLAGESPAPAIDQSAG